MTQTLVRSHPTIGHLLGGSISLVSVHGDEKNEKKNIKFYSSGIEALEGFPKDIKKHAEQASMCPGTLVESLLCEKLEKMKLELQSHITNTAAEALAIQSRRGIGSVQAAPLEKYIPHPSLCRMLREFLGSPTATFKTPEQAEALEFVMANVRHLLLVGPTAMGKSLVYMLPATQRDYGITVVLLPLSSLHLDFDRRCQALKIPCSRWLRETNEDPRTKIVFVSPEDAQTVEFSDYLLHLARIDLIVQIVVDEVHLLKSHADFRYCFSVLGQLVVSGVFLMRRRCRFLTSGAGVPFLLMTATCPPPLRPELFATLNITDCHVIHAPTDRPEVSYNVKLYKSLDKAKGELVGAVLGWETSEDPAFRGLVYCRSKAIVEELAKSIGCKPFHADVPTEERATSFKDWLEGRQRFMVCTSLLGCGVDVEGVGVVFHFGTPWSVLDFVQESGRAGRGGKHSFSFVFASHSEREPEGEEDACGKKLMREWVLSTSGCRRTPLSFFLDGRHVTCMLLNGVNLCDFCRTESKRPHPGKLVKFSTVPVDNIRKPKPLPVLPPTSLTYETICHNSRFHM